MENRSEELVHVLGQVAQENAQRREVSLKTQGVFAKAEEIVRQTGTSRGKGSLPYPGSSWHFRTLIHQVKVDTQLDNDELGLVLTSYTQERSGHVVRVDLDYIMDNMQRNLFKFLPEKAFDHNGNGITDMTVLSRAEAIVAFVGSLTVPSPSPVA